MNRVMNTLPIFSVTLILLGLWSLEAFDLSGITARTRPGAGSAYNVFRARTMRSVPGERIGGVHSALQHRLRRYSPPIKAGQLFMDAGLGGGTGTSNAEQTHIHKAVLESTRRWRKKTKQVITLGPASNSEEMVEKLFLAGADVFRLNFSHGSHRDKLELVRIIRKVEEKYDHPICIIADLQGPKLRVGTFENGKVQLQKGQNFRFDMLGEPGDATRVNLPHKEIFDALSTGDTLLLDDGKLRMTVTRKGKDYVDCIVNIGGVLGDKKGVNMPTITLPISPLTPKDREDLNFSLSSECGSDVIALSFVQKPEDIVELKSIVKGRAMVLAKIEKPQAVDDLDEIVHLSDAIMVARGDLGVEMNPEDVPVTQKKIITVCRKMGKPVVIATQMLESMIQAPTPTRAEASDVATAIYDGADAIMLSAESAVGKYPEESVLMQQRIINRVEKDPVYRTIVKRDFRPGKMCATDAITQAAKTIATTLDAAAIVTFSTMGATAHRAAMLRPSMPIVGATATIETARSLALTWGVYPAVVDPKSEAGSTVAVFRRMINECCATVLKKNIATSPHDLLVITAGIPFGTPGVANILRIVPAAGPDIWDPALTRDCRIDLEETDEVYVTYDVGVE